MRTRPPHSIRWPLTSSQVEGVNTMFEELYRNAARDTQAIIDAIQEAIEDGDLGAPGGAGSDEQILYNAAGVVASDAGFTRQDDARTVSFVGRSDNGEITVSPLSANYQEVLLGGHYAFTAPSTYDYIPESDNFSYLWNQPSSQRYGWEISYDEIPGASAGFGNGIGFILGGPDAPTPSTFDLYQYGGLGTGAVTGMGIRVQNNNSGSGAAAWLGLANKDDTYYYLWPDANGTFRFHTSRPTESGSVSDTVAPAASIAADHFRQGAIPGSYGGLRLSNNAYIVARNAANDGDVEIGAVTGFNNVLLGPQVATDLAFQTNDTVRWRVISTGEFRAENGTETIQWGSTSASPMLKKSSADLHVRLADDSAYANLSAFDLIANNRVLAQPTGLTAVAGASTWHLLYRETAGHAGGTSDLLSLRALLTMTGSNNIAEGKGQTISAENNLSSGTVTSHLAQYNIIRMMNAGSTTNAANVYAYPQIDGAGHITGTYSYFRAATPVRSSTGDITGGIRGLQIDNIGRAAAGEVNCIYVSDQTSGSVAGIGFRGLINSAASKWNLYIDGTAQNFIAGKLGLGSGKSTPTAELEVAGQVRAEGDKGAASTSGLNFIGTVQSDTLPSNFLLRRARDNAGAVEALQTSDTIAALVVQGHDGTAYGPNNIGAVLFRAAENFAVGAKGVDIVFATTPTGTDTRSNRWAVTAAGNLVAQGAHYIEVQEMTAPSAGSSNTCRVFVEDDGAGKTRLMAQFATGAAVQIAIQP